MKHVFLDTVGCQMNVADSDRMELLLFHSGYARTENVEQADLVLINTCSVRDKAEHKIFSLFGALRPLKKNNPDLIFGITGCLARLGGGDLLKRLPELDFILGPDAVDQLPSALRQISEQGGPLVWTEFDSAKTYSLPELDGNQKPVTPSAYVNIIKGCDKFCSFCVVPFTRGREKSREADEILAEVRSLVDRGAREIILLGQNVNAYGKRGLDKPVAFHELLYRVAEVPGLRRLRFTTSYPGDITPELAHAFRDIDKLMNHLHLPVQSGNDRILDAMRRGHTAADYLKLVDAFRAAIPDIAFSTDIIVGFPGETEVEFEDTLRLMRQVAFNNSYIFSYNPRPGTPAVELPDSVPEEVKKSRLQRTLDLQNEITLNNGRALIGTDVEVLIEETTRRRGADFKGRTPQYWSTIITGGSETGVAPGDTLRVRVEAVAGHLLRAHY